MCNFLSAIAYKNGDIFCAPEYTDSHEDLISHLGLCHSRPTVHAGIAQASIEHRNMAQEFPH